LGNLDIHRISTFSQPSFSGPGVGEADDFFPKHVEEFNGYSEKHRVYKFTDCTTRLDTIRLLL